jgi:hypothetical protein
MHFSLSSVPVHRRFLLQQRRHRGHAVCIGGDRRAKNTCPLSSNANQRWRLAVADAAPATTRVPPSPAEEQRRGVRRRELDPGAAELRRREASLERREFRAQGEGMRRRRGRDAEAVMAAMAGALCLLPLHRRFGGECGADPCELSRAAA